MSYKLKRIKWAIQAFLNPRQKWLTKKIPKTWTEYDQLVEICLFEILVNFVEKKMDRVVWEMNDDGINYGDKIKEIYQYIKVDRLLLQKQIEDESDKAYKNFIDNCCIGTNENGWKVTKFDKGNYETVYGELNRLEKLLDDKDTEAMVEIVKIRKVLWT